MPESLVIRGSGPVAPVSRAARRVKQTLPTCPSIRVQTTNQPASIVDVGASWLLSADGGLTEPLANTLLDNIRQEYLTLGRSVEALRIEAASTRSSV